MPDEPAGIPWWHGFFDSTYADLGLRRSEPERLERTASFLLSRLDLSAGSLLFDQCCGVGRISVPLARHGVRIVGVDQVADYVAEAQRGVNDAGGSGRFFVGDAMAFTTPEPCDAAINWFTSFGYDEDDERNAEMLRRVFESIRPGGRLALEFQNVPRVLAEFRPSYFERFPGPGGECLVLIESEPDFRRGVIDSVWTFVTPDGARDARRLTTRMFMPHEIAGLLRRCGFDVIGLVGSVDGEMFDRKSPRLIVIAQRPR